VPTLKNFGLWPAWKSFNFPLEIMEINPFFRARVNPGRGAKLGHKKTPGGFGQNQFSRGRGIFFPENIKKHFWGKKTPGVWGCEKMAIKPKITRGFLPKKPQRGVKTPF